MSLTLLFSTNAYQLNKIKSQTLITHADIVPLFNEFG